MIVKQELIAKIKDCFDLNIYETKVWLALIGKGIASAGEVATLSGVPRSRTYDVLETLEKRGFAIAKLDKPVKYIGVKPKAVLEKIKNDVRRDAEERIMNLSKVRETEEFEKIESLYDTGISPVRREDVSAAIKGKHNISNHLREILQNAEKEVIICTSATEMKLKSKLFVQTFDFLKKAGVKVKIAVSGDDSLIKEIKENFNWLAIKKIGVDSKFFIIDRKEVLFYISKESDEEDIAIWLNSDFFAEAFASLFENALKNSS